MQTALAETIKLAAGKTEQWVNPDNFCEHNLFQLDSNDGIGCRKCDFTTSTMEWYQMGGLAIYYEQLSYVRRFYPELIV